MGLVQSRYHRAFRQITDQRRWANGLIIQVPGESLLQVASIVYIGDMTERVCITQDSVQYTFLGNLVTMVFVSPNITIYGRGDDTDDTTEDTSPEDEYIGEINEYNPTSVVPNFAHGTLEATREVDNLLISRKEYPCDTPVNMPSTGDPEEDFLSTRQRTVKCSYVNYERKREPGDNVVAEDENDNNE